MAFWAGGADAAPCPNSHYTAMLLGSWAGWSPPLSRRRRFFAWLLGGVDAAPCGGAHHPLVACALAGRRRRPCSRCRFAKRSPWASVAFLLRLSSSLFSFSLRRRRRPYSRCRFAKRSHWASVAFPHNSRRALNLRGSNYNPVNSLAR